MKFSLKIASSVIGFSLIAGVAVASAQVSNIWGGSSVTAVKNPEFGVMHLGSSLPKDNASSTIAVVSLNVELAMSTSSCPIVKSFMKLGAANNSADVKNLQSFLKIHENADVEVSGIFDQKTEAAVIAFQRANMADIMGPWGATRASGAVYVTTAKKINEIVCGSPTTLSKNEIAIVTSYKKAADAAAVQVAAGDDAVTAPVVGLDTVSGATVEDADNSAAAGQASVMSRFWSFLGSFFQR